MLMTQISYQQWNGITTGAENLGFKVLEVNDKCGPKRTTVTVKTGFEKFTLFLHWWKNIAGKGLVMSCTEYNRLLDILDAARNEPYASPELERALGRCAEIVEETLASSRQGTIRHRNGWESKTQAIDWREERRQDAALRVL